MSRQRFDEITSHAMPNFLAALESLIKAGDNAALDRLEELAEQCRKLIAMRRHDGILKT
jgi:hypothetical protein